MQLKSDARLVFGMHSASRLLLPFGTERVIPCAGLAPSGGHIHRQQASQVFVVETSAGAVWESPFNSGSGPPSLQTCKEGVQALNLRSRTAPAYVSRAQACDVCCRPAALRGSPPHFVRGLLGCLIIDGTPVHYLCALQSITLA